MAAREQGEFERALELYNESMALWRALGDKAWTARESIALGITHRLAGNLEQAHQLLETSRELHAALGNRYALAVIANNIGHLTFDAGRILQAIEHYAEALKIFDALGDPEGVVEAIEWLAVAVAARGNAVPALRLFGAAAAAREALHLPPRIDSDEKRVASGIEQAERIADTKANSAVANGKFLDLDQARDAALELAGAGPGSAHSAA
jgi:tetratricopeptide (TPR) repeat protein